MTIYSICMFFNLFLIHTLCIWLACFLMDFYETKNKSFELNVTTFYVLVTQVNIDWDYYSIQLYTIFLPST